MKTITIINHKGGVGKTTIAQNLCAGLQNRGYKVLLIEADAQANSTLVYEAEEGKGILQALLRQADEEGLLKKKGIKYDTTNITDLIQKTERGDIIAGSEELSIAERLLYAVYENEDRQYCLLQTELKSLEGIYDYVIIDTPPALTGLSINALVGADYILIPLIAELSSIQALTQITETIENYKDLNPAIKVLGIVINLYRKTNLHNSNLKEIDAYAEQLHTSVFNTKLSSRIDYAFVQADCNTVYCKPKTNKCRIEFDALVDEILERIEH